VAPKATRERPTAVRGASKGPAPARGSVGLGPGEGGVGATGTPCPADTLGASGSPGRWVESVGVTAFGSVMVTRLRRLAGPSLPGWTELQVLRELGSALSARGAP